MGRTLQSFQTTILHTYCSNFTQVRGTEKRVNEGKTGFEEMFNEREGKDVAVIHCPEHKLQSTKRSFQTTILYTYLFKYTQLREEG